MAGIYSVFIEDLTVAYAVGCTPEEKGVTQPLVFNIEIDVLKKDSLNDDINNVYDYREANNILKEMATEGHRDLLETIADEFFERVLENDYVQAVTLRIEKPNKLEASRGIGVIMSKSRTDLVV